MQQQETSTSFSIGPTKTERACLLIHGFNGSPVEMRGLGEALAENGIRVHGMQVAGHSGDPVDLISSSRAQWIASTEKGLAQLAHYPTVFVAGLSMGGVLALSLASRHRERIAGVIALSTPTRFTGGWQVRAVPLARYFVKWFYPLRYLDLHDPHIQAEVLQQAQQRDPQVQIDFSNPQDVAKITELVRIPVPAIAELFKLTNQTRKRIKLIRAPLLIIHSKKDQTVNPACAEELYRLATGTSSKTLHWLEQSDHVITTGSEKEKVYQLVNEFITKIPLKTTNV